MTRNSGRPGGNPAQDGKTDPPAAQYTVRFRPSGTFAATVRVPARPGGEPDVGAIMAAAAETVPNRACHQCSGSGQEWSLDFGDLEAAEITDSADTAVWAGTARREDEETELTALYTLNELEALAQAAAETICGGALGNDLLSGRQIRLAEDFWAAMRDRMTSLSDSEPGPGPEL